MIALLLALLAGAAQASDWRACTPSHPADPPGDWDASFIRTTYECDAQDRVRRKVETFVRTGTPSNETIYDESERRVRYRIWSSEHQQTGEIAFEHQADGTYLKTTIGLKSGLPEGQEQWRPARGGDRLLRRWFYDTDKDALRPPRLTHGDSYLEGWPKERVIERRLYDERGAESKRIAFEYDPSDKPDARPIAFQAFDPAGRRVRTYSSERTLAEALDLRSIYKAEGESDEQIERRLAKVCAPGKIAVAVLDSGFDVFNPHVADKMWRRKIPPAEGSDWRDAVMGWDWERQRPIPLDRIDVPRQGGAPVSHGTHTGTIAVDGLDYAAILGFAGDFTSPAYLDRISRFLQRHDVRFANMSFAMADDGPFAGNPAAITAIGRLIQSNPQTLFAAAAGNEYADLDEGMHMFPANFHYPNLIVVGSIDADSLDEERLPEYQLSDFSNRGKGSVDILAPGKDVEAADMGGGLVRHTGTSMATPMLLRIGALPLAHAHPDLTAAQIRELLIKTAFIPSLEKPFPVRSGGIVFPSRAQAAAALFAKDPSIGIEGAALAVRAVGRVKQGEAGDAEYLARLRAFWRSRGI